MLNVTGYARVYDFDRQKGFIRCNLSTKKKNKDGQYEFMHWRGRIVGDAVIKMDDIKEGDLIKLDNAIVENYFAKDKNRYFTSVVVFSFSKYEQNS
ncbi:MAG: hypothetical protein HGA49_12955 [Eubacteriaceae bacterium]|nr:hypothetical protein [Eubacteriaceae bacterium]